MSIDTDIIPVILSGGAGTRLWPLSREMRPKQLLALWGDETMLQQTALRLGRPPIIICNDEHRFLVAEQMRQIGIPPRAIVVEPVGRNTAPAAAVAALLPDAQDALLLVMPSDHLIRDGEAFAAAVSAAAPLAQSGLMVTFGVVPTEPNTGYGYIHRGATLGGGFHVDKFVEKPDRATAGTYLASGDYFWNSGIFLLPARLYLDELAARHPEMVEACRKALAEGHADLDFVRLSAAAFEAIKSESIDYAVMEHTSRAAMVPVDMGWSDIGSFSALWSESERDEAGNVALGDVIAHGARDCYLRADNQLVAAVGVSDLVVVATQDVVLVADKRADQDVKLVVQELKARARPEATQGVRVYRPWGWYQTIDEGERFRVKHIQVEPGAKLSLQKHWHRSEHWVVVSGLALVTCGDNTFPLRENESTFIPAGTLHRLENPGKLPLRMIEVQSGEYVGEDDIVRVEDVYGRG